MTQRAPRPCHVVFVHVSKDTKHVAGLKADPICVFAIGDVPVIVQLEVASNKRTTHEDGRGTGELECAVASNLLS